MSNKIKNIHFIQGVDFEFFQSLPKNKVEQIICWFLMILVRKSQARKILSKSQQLEGTKDLVQYI